jgi:hypothetical protein
MKSFNASGRLSSGVLAAMLALAIPMRAMLPPLHPNSSKLIALIPRPRLKNGIGATWPFKDMATS